MGKIVACMNEKGGVAKTTTIKNLSIGLAKKGKKVLAVDLDPSANLTKILGISDDAVGILEIFKMSIQAEDIPKGFGIVSQAEGIDFIPASKALHDLESQLLSALQREVILRNHLQPIKDDYDYIFLDCPAGLGIFTMNALFSADDVIIPLQPHFAAVEAMQNLFQLIAKIRKLNGTNYKPALLGILFSMVRVNTSNDKKIMDELRRSYEKNNINVFNTYIPQAAKVPESDLARQSIYKAAPNSAVAIVFNDLVDEFLRIEEGGE